MAYDHGALHLQAAIRCRIVSRQSADLIDTTVGRVLSPRSSPKDPVQLVNKVLDKKALSSSSTLLPPAPQEGDRPPGRPPAHARLRDATKAGISICMDDMVIPEAKKKLLGEAPGRGQARRRPVPGRSHHRRRALQQDRRHLGRTSPTQIANEMMKGIGRERHRSRDRQETIQPSLQPDLHHGRLGRPRLAPSRCVSSPLCAASWPSRPARSSRPRSPRTSARVSRCSSTSSRPTAPVRASPTPR